MANSEFNGYIRHSHHRPPASESFQVKRLHFTTLLLAEFEFSTQMKRSNDAEVLHLVTKTGCMNKEQQSYF